jgi:NAD-dependent SIR2 family protein deacetylase
MSMTEKKPLNQLHVINVLRETRQHHPNFVLFIGAGASASSGVPTAGELVATWRRQFKECHPDVSAPTSVDQPDEYGKLFEYLYNTPSQRREIVESWLKDVRPAWGYMLLASLIDAGVFNTVFTTNFDDLLNEACYAFSDNVRPIVCAHDSGIRSVRLTSRRPKIIKLHGDFLFDSIKNTPRETETLEQNTKLKIRQYAQEFGMIVLGYGGNDRSVMEVLEQLLSSDDAFPHGVYWGVKKGSSLSSQLSHLQRFPRFYTFEIDGFDPFCADLHQGLGLNLPQTVSDPYTALRDRLNRFIKSIGAGDSAPVHPLIKSQIDELRKRIESHFPNPQPSEATHHEPTPSAPVPFQFLAAADGQANRFEEAKQNMLKAIEADPSAEVYRSALELAWEARDAAWGKDRAEDMLKRPDIFRFQPDEAVEAALPLINLGLFNLAVSTLNAGRKASLAAPHRSNWDERVFLVNQLQIKRHRGQSLTADEIAQTEELARSPSVLYQLAAALLLGEFPRAAELFLQCCESGRIRTQGTTKHDWPIFRLFPTNNASVPEKVAAQLTEFFEKDWTIKEVV